MILSFKEFLLERDEEADKLVPKSRTKPYLKVSGIQSLLTPHSQDRMKERDVDKDRLDKVLTMALEFAAKKPAEAGKSEEVLYYSTKAKQAIIASYRRDKGGNPADKEKYFFVVSILPYGKNKATSGTHKVTFEESIMMVEQMLREACEELNINFPKTVVNLDIL